MAAHQTSLVEAEGVHQIAAVLVKMSVAGQAADYHQY